MLTSSPTLCLLLSVALLFSGNTGASVHISHLSEPDVLQVEPSTDQAVRGRDVPCHEVYQAHALAAAHSDASEGTDASSARASSPECCDAGPCLCACMHPPQAALLNGIISADMIGYANSERSISSNHISPVLPPLIRPPIG